MQKKLITNSFNYVLNTILEETEEELDKIEQGKSGEIEPKLAINPPMAPRELKEYLLKEKLDFFNNKFKVIYNFITENISRTKKESVIDYLLSNLNMTELGEMNKKEDSINFKKLKDILSAPEKNRIYQVLYDFPSEMIGRGELLAAWLLKAKMGNKKWDLTLEDKTPIEVKEQGGRLKHYIYRFGTSKDLTIAGRKIGNIYIWNEIDHLIKIVYKLNTQSQKIKDVFFDAFEENNIEKVKKLFNYFVENGDEIINGALNPDTISNLSEFFYLLSTIEVETKEEDKTYSRVDLRGKYTKRNKLYIEPIKKSDVESAKEKKGEITLELQDETDNMEDVIFGTFNDVFYVRHAQEKDKNFASHFTEASKQIIFKEEEGKNKNYILFGRSFSEIIFTGDGKTLKNHIVSTTPEADYSIKKENLSALVTNYRFKIHIAPEPEPLDN